MLVCRHLSAHVATHTIIVVVFSGPSCEWITDVSLIALQIILLSLPIITVINFFNIYFFRKHQCCLAIHFGLNFNRRLNDANLRFNNVDNFILGFVDNVAKNFALIIF